MKHLFVFVRLEAEHPQLDNSVAREGALTFGSIRAMEKRFSRAPGNIFACLRPESVTKSRPKINMGLGNFLFWLTGGGALANF